MPKHLQQCSLKVTCHPPLNVQEHVVLISPCCKSQTNVVKGIYVSLCRVAPCHALRCVSSHAVLCYDVSCVQGKDAIPFLEGLVTGDIAGLADGTGSLSVFTNEKGGIIDDTVITKVRQKGLTWDITGQRDRRELGKD